VLGPESAVFALGIEPDVAQYSLQPLYEDDGQEWRFKLRLRFKRLWSAILAWPDAGLRSSPA